HLTVFGGDDPNGLAELATDRIWICGPEVNIHQGWNKAWVVGQGAMQMESATDLQGTRLDKPVPMNVHWDRSMLFNGLTAEFFGEVHADQQNKRQEGQNPSVTKGQLKGQHLVVTFDRMISLKEGARSDQPARVKKLVCDQDVRVREDTYDAKDENK